MESQAKQHWERVYTTKESTRVSWFQEHARQSVELIRQTGASHEAAIIDVGGGASTLVDDLIDDGYSNLTVLDLSAAALSAARARLGAKGDRVSWQVGDVTQFEFPRHAYEVWHDRAVFHFLITQQARDAYVRAVLHAVRPGGNVIVATFAEDGPDQCSGLPVARYSPDALHAEFGAPFTLLRHTREEHHTPFGTVQQFVYCLCRKNSPPPRQRAAGSGSFSSTQSDPQVPGAAASARGAGRCSTARVGAI
ncbi:MAG: class I SAM-dependent methyltransferase [Burkholderiaceae bacterium]